eukprot:COSAG06_NODE_25629_length_632_cov_1.146341_1_plen_34_part_10
MASPEPEPEMSPRTAQRRAFFGDLSAWIDAAPEL